VSAKKQPGFGHTGSNVTAAVDHLAPFCTIARPEIKYKNIKKKIAVRSLDRSEEKEEWE
jgi:hypothetical protein